MHDRLLPLNPPQPPFMGQFPRFGLHHLTLMSMPWMELGFFTLMIVGLMRLGT
jgi:hypothetical protein